MLPVLMLLVFGIFEVGLNLSRRHILFDAARAAVRAGAVRNADEGAETVAREVADRYLRRAFAAGAGYPQVDVGIGGSPPVLEVRISVERVRLIGFGRPEPLTVAASLPLP